jgi:hypothetical protein
MMRDDVKISSSILSFSICKLDLFSGSHMPNTFNNELVEGFDLVVPRKQTAAVVAAITCRTMDNARGRLGRTHASISQTT